MQKYWKKNIYFIILVMGLFVSWEMKTYASSNIDKNQKEVNTGEDKKPTAPELNGNTAKGEAYQEAVSSIINSNPVDAKAPELKKPQVPETTYQTYFSFDYNRVLKGVISTEGLYFYIPEYWDTKFLYAEIEFSVSQLINEDLPASLTFMLNDEPFSSCRISAADGETQLLYVKIPTESIKTGYNQLSITSYVRLYDYEGCEEDSSWANWVNIDKKSYIYAGYELKETDNQINYFPYPFISTANPTGLGTGVFVSDKADNSEIAAALYLMSDISSEAVKENEIYLGLLKDAENSGTDRKIIISLLKNLPEEYKGYLQADGENSGGLDLNGRAMVKFEDDIDGRPLLLIVADKAENLMEAVNMLLDNERLSQEKVSTAYVKEGSAKTVYESRLLSQLVVDNYTLNDIMGSGLTFVGPFHKESTLYLPFQNDYILASSGKITLKFRYSDNLDFNRSLISVYWGEIPIASKKLTQENAGGDELTFTIPADIVGSSANSIKIAFDLELQDLFCTLRQDEMPWAYVSGDSVLYLPAQASTKVSFDYQPAPYQSDGRFSAVRVITSNNPDSRELNLLGKTLSLYGENVGAYGTLKVQKAKEFSEQDSDYNMITAGTFRSNEFLQKLNSSLYFPYDKGGDTFLSSSQLVLSDNYAQDIAAFQLLKSPFSEGRAILAVCGTSDNTIDIAMNFLSSSENRGKLEGDCVLIDNTMDTKSFQFIKDNTKAKPTIKEFVKQNKQSVMFTVVAASALFMILFAAVIILIRARRHRKNEEN
ncbi:MAG: cellulose biosynthesis cyclic di-GMP-binding regulatory protein BcsB [Anaerocolumna sp.]